MVFIKRSSIASFLLLLAGASLAHACDLLVNIENGQICGSERLDGAGRPYASFRGVPYAKQPLGELRFKELQPAEPIEGIFNATTEGPACHQKFIYFEQLQKSQDFSESCIHANIHVPIEALPSRKEVRRRRTYPSGLPILLVVFGGGFHFGSGSSEIYGPEYLVSKDVIVITFNYRINIFGHLSLDTAEIPGNQALRDVITMMRWVQRNAKAFGGDPSNVTVFGFSSGSAVTHLVHLSPVAQAEDLYKRVVLSSGAGFPGFHTEWKSFAKNVADTIIPSLGINSTDPVEIHRQLCAMPIEQIKNATWYTGGGIVFFMPVVESSFPGVTRMIDDRPEELLRQGRGKDKPMMIGFGIPDDDGSSFQPDIEKRGLVSVAEQNHETLVPVNLAFSPTLDNATKEQAVQSIMDEYFSDGNVTIDSFLPYITDGSFKYPAIKSALAHVQNGAPVFLYQFAFSNGIIEDTFGIEYEGAAHLDDITNYFKLNALIPSDAPPVFPPQNKNDEMRDWMTGILTNFMRCSNPTCKGDDAAEWPALDATSVDQLRYQDISEPQYHYVDGSSQYKRVVDFFDSLQPKL